MVPTFEKGILFSGILLSCLPNTRWTSFNFFILYSCPSRSTLLKYVEPYLKKMMKNLLKELGELPMSLVFDGTSRKGTHTVYMNMISSTSSTNTIISEISVSQEYTGTYQIQVNVWLLYLGQSMKISCNHFNGYFLFVQCQSRSTCTRCQHWYNMSFCVTWM